MSDLLPCLYGCGYRPQCGEARELDDTGIFYQFCEVCGATGPTSDSPRGADLAWNRRPSPWVPVAERLPGPGVEVLLHIINEHGKSRRLRAQYSDGKSLPANDDGIGADDWAVYDEEADEYYCPEGWFETNEYEDTHWQVVGLATHWMPLPAPPDKEENR